MQCALVLGSAKERDFAKDKKVAIIMHQKASHLQIGLYNNVLGLSPKTLGTDILVEGKAQLAELYPKIEQIEKEFQALLVELDRYCDQLKKNQSQIS